MKYLFLFIVLTSFQAIYAQDTTATVIVHKDPRVDVLVKKQSEVNAAIKKATARTAKGYRLLVINTNKRDEAIAAKTKIYSNFPELKAYLVYQAPFFRLKAGNFQTRDEAVRYQKSLNAVFPKGVFVINDVIEIKPENADLQD